MPDKDQNHRDSKSLSPEDEALWQKVQRTVNEPQGRQKTRHLKTSGAPKNPQSSAPPSRAEFAALLEESASDAQPLNKKPEKQDSPAGLRPIKKPATPARPRLEPFSQKEARSLSGGRQQIEGMIDLHGHTRKTAENALKNFLRRARKDGKRYVLVITGKGGQGGVKRQAETFELGAPEPGILKRQVPEWLDDMAETVLSYKTAHKKHGGEGALYVRLRKIKEKKIQT